jgi:hypothetical protein
VLSLLKQAAASVYLKKCAALLPLRHPGAGALWNPPSPFITLCSTLVCLWLLSSCFDHSMVKNKRLIFGLPIGLLVPSFLIPAVYIFPNDHVAKKSNSYPKWSTLFLPKLQTQSYFSQEVVD